MDSIDLLTIDPKNIVLLCVAEQRVSPIPFINKLNSTVWIYSSMDIIDFITIDPKNIVLLCVAEQRVSPSPS